jgi:hypothetical protein
MKEIKATVQLKSSCRNLPIAQLAPAVYLTTHATVEAVVLNQNMPN